MEGVHNMRVKQLKVQDFKYVREIFLECFSKKGYSSSDFAYSWRVRCGDSLGFYTREGDMVGFCLVQRVIGSNNRYISYFAVREEWRANGGGARMLAEMRRLSVEKRFSVYLYSLRSERLRCWYLKNGFNRSSKGYFNHHFYDTRSKS